MTITRVAKSDGRGGNIEQIATSQIAMLVATKSLVHATSLYSSSACRTA